MRKSSTPYLFKCYIWFVNTIANGPISREAIDEKWARASVNDYQTDSIPESTFYRWRNTVEELFDIEIRCNEQGEYYIEEADLFRRADLRGRVFNLLSINNLLRTRNFSASIGDTTLFSLFSLGQKYNTH